MRSCTWLLAGLALFSLPQLSLAESGLKNASEDSVDDRIVAVLDYTKDSHMGRPCGGDANQNSQKIEIYATGRAVHSVSDIDYSCNSMGEINRSEPKPVKGTFQIAVENLPVVLDAFALAQREVREHAFEHTLDLSSDSSRLTIKIAPDSEGVSSLVGLKSVVEADDATETVWKRISQVVQKYEGK